MAQIELVDLDSVEIVAEIERTFRITIAAEEAASCATMRDLFAVVTRKLPTLDRGSFPCPAALAFWRLRTAIHAQVPGKQLTPSTLVTDLLPPRGQSRWWQTLQRTSGLAMPSTRPKQKTGRSSIWAPGLILATLSCALGAGAWSLLVGFTVCSLLAALRPRANVLAMDASATLGDLAKITAALNIGLLTQHAGAIRPPDAWNALATVTRHFTNHPGPIDKRTKFNCT